MQKTFVAMLLVASSAFAWAEPSLKQVESEVRLGHLSQAESMMSEVTAAHADSAKAHYVYAEVLSRNQKFKEAAAEAATARTLDPAIKFTDPKKFQDFEQLLTRQQEATRMRGVPAARTSTIAAAAADTTSVRAPVSAAPMAPAVAASPGIPSWVWLVALIAIGAFLWRGFQRSRAATPGMGSPGAVAYGSAGYPPNGPKGPSNPNAPYNPNGPYGQSMPQAAPGGGMLRTGMAVAGGVAGGILIDQMLNHHANAAGLSQNGGNNDLGLGPTMAPQGNDASTELETRQVDFGNGGDDWGGGGGDGGIDLGGSDGGGGGGWD